MPTFTSEASDIPILFVVRPTYNAVGAVVGCFGQINWVNRTKNDADSTDIFLREVASKSVDMFDSGKTVTVSGTTLTYRQVSSFLKKIADAEHL